MPNFSILKAPATGTAITRKGGRLVVPDNPIIPYIEGDGTGADIWRASVRVFDAAVNKAFGGKKKIEWFEVPAETVTRAAGDKTETGRRVHQGAGDFVHGAVAADGDDQSATVGHRLPGQLGGVARPLGAHEGSVQSAFLDEGGGPIAQIGVAAVAAGVGVEDEPGFQRRSPRRKPRMARIARILL